MTTIDWDRPTRAEAVRDEFEANRPHPDVVCPPDPSARCGHCGIALGDHTTVGPDQKPTPATAICLDRSLLWNRFTLAPGESLDCPHAMACELCGSEICGEHSTTEVVECSESDTTLHHAECVDGCEDCVRSYAQGMAEDRAIEQWKGMW